MKMCATMKPAMKKGAMVKRVLKKHAMMKCKMKKRAMKKRAMMKCALKMMQVKENSNIYPLFTKSFFRYLRDKSLLPY